MFSLVFFQFIFYSSRVYGKRVTRSGVTHVGPNSRRVFVDRLMICPLPIRTKLFSYRRRQNTFLFLRYDFIYRPHQMKSNRIFYRLFNTSERLIWSVGLWVTYQSAMRYRPSGDFKSWYEHFFFMKTQHFLNFNTHE